MSLTARIFYSIILLSDNHPSLFDKLRYAMNIIISITPIIYITDSLGVWFVSNQQFLDFLFFFFTANMFMGVWRHKKTNTFNWEDFWKKNLTMWILCLLVYIVLEMFRITAESNETGTYFGSFVQLTTLFWPGSKIIKNAYFLSNRQFPPSFLMERLYSFEKTGIPSNLFNPKNKE